MNKFNEYYNEIINQYQSVTDVEFDFINFNKLSNNYEVITEDTIQILNEYVSDPELTPIPKEILNHICSKVKYRKDNITIIPIKNIYDMLKEYDYPFYDEFKSSLKNVNGNLYIVMLFDRDYSQQTMLKFNKTFLFVNSYINDTNISKTICHELLRDNLKTADAFCSKTDNDLKNNKFFENNCLIFISLKCEFIKDSLEHELTHFIQKTVGVSKTVYNSIKNDNKFNSFENLTEETGEKLINWIKTNITSNDQYINHLLKFFMIKFSYRELHQSIKAVLNGIQRIYEYNKFSYVNTLDLSNSNTNKHEAKNDLQYRLNWLNKFFQYIYSNEFIKTDLSPVILNLFNTEEQAQYLIKNRVYFIILLYFGFINVFPELNIKEKVIEHFKTFKYKDN